MASAAPGWVLLRGGEALLDGEPPRLVSGDVLLNTTTGLIADPAAAPAEGVAVVDCAGMIVAPGFIELQLNGCAGVDFSSPSLTAEQLAEAARWLPRTGVTSVLPTVVSATPDAYRSVAPAYEAAKQAPPGSGARIMGTHLEGPYLAGGKRGAHRGGVLVQPADASPAGLYGPALDSAALVTLAPELPGAPELIRELRKRGVAVAIGHSEATLHQARGGVDAGAVLLTHLFNAMPPFHHREPGVVGLLGEVHKVRPMFSLICDGVHVHPAAAAIAQRAHPAGVVLVTDAMSVLGLPEGVPGSCGHGEDVVRKDGRVCLVKDGGLAGGCATMDECVRNFQQWTGCSAAEALAAASTRPAQALGIQGAYGTLRVGAAGDVLLLSRQLRVQRAYVRGRLAWGAAGASL
eukprot:TRINITY_DN56335_c0_g1_i1.p1 TRINITY_DN56335_c0_g1~~TRINITY_DN56335_c0_g1_i1.p1  ORF type:complete len:431 (+),score=126.04 TRINITY_DN56335_c0_g1_i1:79-1293(+)